MDIISKQQRSELMSKIRGKDTSPERYIRSLLHRRGYRFGLHSKTIQGRPDLVLVKYGVLVFVNGCFWHGHDACPLYRPPKTSKKFWHEKIKRNQQRDLRINRKLLSEGWRVLHIWECAFRSNTKIPEEKLVSAMELFIHGTGKSKSIRGKRLSPLS